MKPKSANISTTTQLSQKQNGYPAPIGPVGEGNYTVKQGDCIESIAQQHGFFWETIWKHPGNKELRQVRKDHNVLLPGDQVQIPELQSRIESGSTNARHRFKRKGVPSRLRLRLLEGDDPRANQSYMLDVDGKLFFGTTDNDGRIDQPIPPNAQRGKLILTETEEEYPLRLGSLDPITEIIGFQERLNNIGFDCGFIDGILGAKTISAIKQFQEKYNLQPTGKPDQATQDKLLSVHGG